MLFSINKEGNTKITVNGSSSYLPWVQGLCASKDYHVAEFYSSTKRVKVNEIEKTSMFWLFCRVIFVELMKVKLVLFIIENCSVIHTFVYLTKCIISKHRTLLFLMFTWLVKTEVLHTTFTYCWENHIMVSKYKVRIKLDMTPWICYFKKTS